MKRNTRIMAQIKPEFKDEIKEAAQELRMNQSEFIRRACSQKVDEVKN